jgi:DNA-binding CsgD family transcriptional regulator
MGWALAGRGDEVARLRQVIAGLPEQSAAVLVVGEAGIGKTALVESVLEGLHGSEVRVLRGACAPLARSIPYGAIVAAFAQLETPGTPASSFPSMAAGRAWVIEGFTGRIQDSAQRTILLIEDVHWADQSTRDFLAHLTRNLPAAGLLVLLTFRDDDEETTPAAREWFAEQLRNSETINVPLQRLDVAQTHAQLVAIRAGATPEMARDIHARSGGNPYLTAELSQADASLSASLRTVLTTRLDRAGPRARQAVAAAGVLGRPLDDDELTAAAEGDTDAVCEALARHLLVRDERGARPRHPVLAKVAYDALLAPQSRALHRRLAQHFEAHRGASSPVGAAEIAEQYRRAGDADDLLVWSARAARAAEERFAAAEAGHWYAVAAFAWDGAVAAQSLVADLPVLAESAARLLGEAGDQDQALSVLEVALSHRCSPASRATLLLARSWSRLVLGDSTASLADIESARRLVPASDRAAQALVLYHHARFFDVCSRVEDAAEPARDALRLARELHDRRLEGKALCIVGTVTLLDAETEDEGLSDLAEALSIAREIAEPDDIALASVALSDAYLARDRADDVLAILQQVRADLRRLAVNGHWIEEMMLSNAIETLFAAGRWDEAIALSLDGHGHLGLVEVATGTVETARGDTAQARALLDRCPALDREQQPQFKHPRGNVEARLLLLDGRPAQALQVALTAAEHVHGGGEEARATSLLLAGVTAAVQAGDAAGFARIVDLLHGFEAGRHATALRAVIEAERSGLRGQPSASGWLDAAREWHALGRPYEAAEAQLRAAESLLAEHHRAGGRAAATRALRHSAAIARRLGAMPLLARIEELARVARIRLPDARAEPAFAEPTAAEPFTDREVQVLGLLTQGKTNREIGDALYISPKTASVHVTHILEKLGVQTRVQAAAFAARHGLEPPADESVPVTSR